MLVVQKEFLFRSNPKQDISDEIILKQATWKDALRLSKSVSGLDDKQIAGELEIDPAQWSRIWSDQANFPERKIMRFMEVCGNLIPLRWLSLKCGYGLTPLKSMLEMENESLKKALEEKEKELEIIRNWEKQKTA